MLKRIKYKMIFCLVILLLLNGYVYAEENEDLNTNYSSNIVDENSNSEILEQNNEIILDENNTVYIDDVFNTGKDNGYSKKDSIKNGDLHYGWKLGKFAISDFSSKRKDSNGNWVLLKNVNDKVSLYFILSQNINKLDNNEKLNINQDENGYDNEFNVKKSDFGRGMLIIRKIDSTGNKNEPILYRDYLNGISVGANTKVDVFEEGDYEVALDYEIKDNGFLFFDGYSNYRIRFNFSVRNGNCMVFPFDVSTKSELNNTSITENGFYLDLANSKYLNINIKKEVLKEGADGLIEDTRFNRPVKSGEEFTEEGIYTITAKNEYTGEITIKKIYVGTNKILKAHIQNSEYSISEINNMVAKGAVIDENGNLSNLPNEYKSKIENNNFFNESVNNTSISLLPILIPILILILFIVFKIYKKKKIEKLETQKIEYKKKIIEQQEDEQNLQNNINTENVSEETEKNNEKDND